MDGSCVSPPVAPQGGSLAPPPQALAPDAPAEQPRGNRPIPAKPTKPAAPRQTCGSCGEDCLDKADAAKATDRSWATHLASQYCREDCMPGTAMLMRCHGYGLLMGSRITPH